MKVQQQQRGFTIIEVVLVLAIAGLIFLMVFIALPALQASQRDTQRKSDVARINTQLSNYQSSNRGKIPATGDVVGGTFAAKYLDGTGSKAGEDYLDPTSGEGYTFSTPDNTGSIPLGHVTYTQGSICGTDGALEGGNNRNYALRIRLEGQVALYCVDNR